MAIIGLSLIFASLVFVIVRPQPWLYRLIPFIRYPKRTIANNSRGADAAAEPGGGGGGGVSAPVIEVDEYDSGDPERLQGQTKVEEAAKQTREREAVARNGNQTALDRMAMPPPPPPPPPRMTPPTLRSDGEPTPKSQAALDGIAMPPSPPPPRIAPPTLRSDGATTPKAQAPSEPPIPVPSFSLSDPAPSASGLSSSSRPPAAISPRPPTLASFPAPNSAQRARPSPLPNRGGGLSPPPTHTTPPAKPSRQVVLTPGHSPLDWARLSGNPNADLRGLGPEAGAGLLRVTPTMLRRQTGRKGKDAWMAIGGRVYNVTPYMSFHPGGEPELMRGAGRDGTQLFGEVHPWVNYETMLSACLVGILVGENEAGGGSMEEMD